jgi:hypothetical protein
MDRGFAGRRRLSVFGACGCAVLLACIDVALALGAVTPSATSPALSFAGPRNYATGLTPESVAIGDLNGDRRPDLATANVTWGTVSVFLNRGGGRLRRTPDSATDASPASIAIGDLNGDGKPDLATANGRANSVSVLLNRPGLCTVQDVTRQTVSAAKRMIARANCRVGKIRRAYSKTVMPGAGLEPARPRRGHLILSRPCRSRSVSVGLSFSCLPGLFVVLIVYGISACLGGSRCHSCCHPWRRRNHRRRGNVSRLLPAGPWRPRTATWLARSRFS